jgi:hypothetical protein
VVEAAAVVGPRERAATPVCSADEREFERVLDRWLGRFAPGEVDRIAFGVLSLRRRCGCNWARADQAFEWPSRPAGDHVLRIFAGQTLVSELVTDDSLLDLVLEPAVGLRLDETHAHDGGAFDLVAAQLRLPDGIALRPRLSRPALDVVGRLDGTTPLRDIAGSDALPHLRELLALGFLQSASR